MLNICNFHKYSVKNVNCSSLNLQQALFSSLYFVRLEDSVYIIAEYLLLLNTVDWLEDFQMIIVALTSVIYISSY